MSAGGLGEALLQPMLRMLRMDMHPSESLLTLQPTLQPMLRMLRMDMHR
jgi:hypothetical protein